MIFSTVPSTTVPTFNSLILFSRSFLAFSCSTAFADKTSLCSSGSTVMIFASTSFCNHTFKSSTYFVDNKEDLDKQEVASDSNGKTKGKYLGRFKITHYCPCYTCNGSNSGRTAWAGQIIPGQTIAVDSSVIGKLQWVYIDGYGYRRAEDCGAFGGNHIDVAVPTHSMALDMGVVYKDVYLAE